MPILTPGLRLMTAGLAAGATHISVGTGGTATTPGTEVSGVNRVAAVWPTGDTDGSWTAPAPVDISTPKSGQWTWWGLWSAATGGTLLAWGRMAAGTTEDPFPTGVDVVRVTPTLESLTA